jgi:hypothetical protein
MRIILGDIPKIIFNIYYDKYEFLIISFELINILLIFQELMNSILYLYIDKFILIYFDDIIIYSNSIKEYD